MFLLMSHMFLLTPQLVLVKRLQLGPTPHGAAENHGSTVVAAAWAPVEKMEAADLRSFYI